MAIEETKLWQVCDKAVENEGTQIQEDREEWRKLCYRMTYFHRETYVACII
jgi:hypothetical protein